MDPLFIIAPIIIAVLIAIRVIVRHGIRGPYVEVFQTISRNFTTPEALTEQLRKEGIRYRIVFKGPPNQPFIGMAGEQFISIQAHINDADKARRVISRVLNRGWRGH